MMCESVIITHMDHAAAAHPELSGRPLELFIDASDFGWAAVLCQRETPHGAPKIIAIGARGFSEVQLRWSATERELYAIWQGLVGLERLVKGCHVLSIWTTRTTCTPRTRWIIEGDPRR